MATEPYFGKDIDDKIYFSIENAPGPFQLVAQEVHSYEKWRNRFVVDLTVVPMCSGEKLLGHRNRFKIPFDVVLHGATCSLGAAKEEPRNVRLLGGFLASSESHKFVPQETDAWDILSAFQWEVLFGPNSRKGLVFRLREPLANEWTL